MIAESHRFLNKYLNKKILALVIQILTLKKYQN